MVRGPQQPLFNVQQEIPQQLVTLCIVLHLLNGCWEQEPADAASPRQKQEASDLGLPPGHLLSLSTA